jgi:hypothetical protein
MSKKQISVIVMPVAYFIAGILLVSGFVIICIKAIFETMIDVAIGSE